MALHNVDKSNFERDTPKPNSHDTLEAALRQSHGTNSVNYQTPGGIPPTSGARILGGNARLVKSGVVSHVVPNGVDGAIHVTTTTTAHGLGFGPLALAYINNATINGGGAYNIPLPLPITLGANTGGTGGAPSYLGITAWMQFASDGTNFYVTTYTTGSSFIGVTYLVTFYLYQQTAAG